MLTVPATFALVIAAALGPGIPASHDRPAANHAAAPSTPPPIAAVGPASVAPQVPPPPRETPEVKDDDAILFDFASALVRHDAHVENRRNDLVIRWRRR